MADLEKNVSADLAEETQIAAAKGAEIMEKYEKESRTRVHKRIFLE